jgi:hypothetical protein
MTEEEHRRAIGEAATYWAEKLRKSEARVFFWKMTAIFGIGVLLWSVLELRGCLAHDQSQSAGPAVEP